MAKRANHAARGRILVPFPEELLVQAGYALEIGPEVLGKTRSGAIRRLVELALMLDGGWFGEEGVHSNSDTINRTRHWAVDDE